MKIGENSLLYPTPNGYEIRVYDDDGTYHRAAISEADISGAWSSTSRTFKR